MPKRTKRKAKPPNLPPCPITPNIHREVVESLQLGVPIGEALAFSLVNRNTYDRWLSLARKYEKALLAVDTSAPVEVTQRFLERYKPYYDFWRDTERARTAGLRLALARIHKGAEATMLGVDRDDKKIKVPTREAQEANMFIVTKVHADKMAQDRRNATLKVTTESTPTNTTTTLIVLPPIDEETD